MPNLTRESIIDNYRELVRERNGAPIGEGIFIRETGISKYYWRAGYWRTWSAFQAEAGYAPNAPNEKIPDDTLLHRFAELALERNEIPTQADMMLKKKEDPSFPGRLTFNRFGDRAALLTKLADYCDGKDQFAPVLRLLKEGIPGTVSHRLDVFRVKGFVYLLRSGKYYKLGRTNAVGRRVRELAIQLPQKPNTVHVIETDDPEGIEQYWHRRFADKRQEGEWFALSSDDVKAFKRRRFQ
jgi:hypothetical protein